MDRIVEFGIAWKPIPGFDGYYASEDGQILSYVKSKAKPRILHQTSTPDGHKYVFLTKGEKQIKMFVHRAILMAWVRMPGPDEEGRHLNDKPWENNLDNLAWGTRMENVEDKRRNGRISVGEKTGSHKLTDELVLQIRNRYSAGESSADLAEEYGVAKNTILLIVRGEKWSHLPVVPVNVKHISKRKTPISAEQIAIGTEALKKSAAERKKHRRHHPEGSGHRSCGAVHDHPQLH